MAPMPRLRYRRHGDDGLTLIEMVVAIGVLMVVLLSSLAVFVTVQHAQQTAEGTDRAIQLINSRIERIRQLDWTTAGFDQNDYDAVWSACACASVKSDYDTNYRSIDGNVESTVFIPRSAAAPAVEVAPADLKPYEVTTEARNKFEVFTTITWGTKRYGSESAVQAANRESDTTQSGPEFYSFKRVRITVVWKSNGTGSTHRTVDESWFSPKGYQEVPPNIPVHTDTYSPPPPPPVTTPPPPPYCPSPLTSGTNAVKTDSAAMFRVSFGKTFSSAPAVVGTVIAANGTSRAITIESVSTVGFTGNFKASGADAANANLTIHWMAANQSCYTPDEFQNATTTATTNSTSVVSITFPQAFSTAPVVTATAGGQYALAIMPGSVSTTGFKAHVRNAWTGAPRGSGIAVPVDWIATTARNTVNPTPIAAGSTTGNLSSGKMRIPFGQAFPSPPAVVASGADGTTSTCSPNCAAPTSGEVVTVTDVTATDFGIQVNAIPGALYTTNTVHINWLAKVADAQPCTAVTKTLTQSVLINYRSLKGTVTFPTAFPDVIPTVVATNALTQTPLNVSNVTATGFTINGTTAIAGQTLQVTWTAKSLCPPDTVPPAIPVPTPITPAPTYCPAPLPSANQVVVTNSSGVGTFSFGTTFASAPAVVGTAGNGELVTLQNVSTTGFTAVFRNNAGTALVGYVRLHWMATPQQCTTPQQWDVSNTVVVTNSSGVAWIPFTQTFSAAPVVTALGGNGEQIDIQNPFTTTTGFYAHFRYAGGANVVGNVRIHYMAVLAQRRNDAYPLAADNQVVSTNSSGQAYFSFGQTFPSVPMVAATGGNDELVDIVSVDQNGFTARFRSLANGAPLVGLVRLLWIAKPEGTFQTIPSCINVQRAGSGGNFLSWTAPYGVTSYKVLLTTKTGSTTTTLASSATSYSNANMGTDTNVSITAIANGNPVPQCQPVFGPPAGIQDVLTVGQSLSMGQYILSTDSQYEAVEQADGNFVTYDFTPSLHYYWATYKMGTGNVLVMQSDGNLVVYNSAGTPVWNTGTYGSGSNNFLVIQTDGNMGIYNGNTGAVVWNAGIPQP